MPNAPFPSLSLFPFFDERKSERSGAAWPAGMERLNCLSLFFCRRENCGSLEGDPSSLAGPALFQLELELLRDESESESESDPDAAE